MEAYIATTDTTLLDLPPTLVIRVLQAFAEQPLNIINFGLTCKAAYGFSKDEGMWSNFCSLYSNSGKFVDPAAWHAASFKQLWIGLVLPHRHLLGRLWHSHTWPDGQLCYVDLEAPRLVGRSLYYNSLNGAPFCHDLFVVQFDQSAGALGKARVTCWRDRHSDHTFESPAELKPAHGGGFVLCCSGRCDSVQAEAINRRLRGRPYLEVRQQSMLNDHAGTVAYDRGIAIRAINAHQQQQQQQRGECSAAHGVQPDSHTRAGAGTGGSASHPLHAASKPPAPRQQRLLPLPDVAIMPNLDFVHFISLAELRPSFSSPVFSPLSFTPWFGPMLNDGSNSSCSNSGSAVDPAASLLGLAGLWRGTYGSHGVEVVQLQLLRPPHSFNFFAATGMQLDGVAAGADAEGFMAAEGVPGVLRQEITRAENTSTQQQQQQQADSSSRSQQGSLQQPDGEEQQKQHQGGPYLLVATKLHGDKNVPVGQVTFVVDGNTRSAQGAGSARVLPAHYDSDVPLHDAGTRPLIVKERYRGRAQIASNGFQSPKIISAELLLFEDPDSLGLLWGQPIQALSLFSRTSHLPGTP